MLPRYNDVQAQLKKSLNPLERISDLFSGKDDRLDIQIMLLYQIASLLAGPSESATGGEPFPSGLQVNIPLAISSVKLMDKILARTTDVVHSTTLADCRKSLRMIVLVQNTLDQAVTADIVGNISNVMAQGTFIIATINVPAGTSRAYGIKYEEWMPWIGVDATPAGVPTTGELNASLIHQFQGEV